MGYYTLYTRINAYLYNNMDELQKNEVEWKKPDTQEQIV